MPALALLPVFCSFVCLFSVVLYCLPQLGIRGGLAMTRKSLPWSHRVTGTDFSYGLIAPTVVIPRFRGADNRWGMANQKSVFVIPS